MPRRESDPDSVTSVEDDTLVSPVHTEYYVSSSPQRRQQQAPSAPFAPGSLPPRLPLSALPAAAGGAFGSAFGGMMSSEEPDEWGQYCDIESPPVTFFPRRSGHFGGFARPRVRGPTVYGKGARSGSEGGDSEEGAGSENEEEGAISVRGIKFSRAAAEAFLVSTHPSSKTPRGADKLRQQFAAAPHKTRVAVLTKAVSRCLRERGGPETTGLIRGAFLRTGSVATVPSLH